MITVKEEFLRCDKLRRAFKSAGPGVVLMWLSMKAYSAEHLTDGFVPRDDVDALVDVFGDVSETRKWLRALIECGRLQPDGTRGNGLVDEVEHGFRLHDYLEHEQSADDAKEKKLKKAARQKRWKDAQKAKEGDGGDVLVDVSNASPETSARRSADASPVRARTPVPLPSPLLKEKEINHPPRRDPMSESLAGGPTGRQDVLDVHAVWKVSVGKPQHRFRVSGAAYDIDAQTIAEAIDTYGLEACLAVAKHATHDGMVNGKLDDKRTKHDSIRYIFGNNDAFNRILKSSQEASGNANRKRNPSEIVAEAKSL